MKIFVFVFVLIYCILKKKKKGYIEKETFKKKSFFFC
jgi:hypothetical protein